MVYDPVICNLFARMAFTDSQIHAALMTENIFYNHLILCINAK
jgi:hypothetical protein